MFSLSDYSFELPENLIAETAAHPAHSAKMMVINKKTGEKIKDATFWDLPQFLQKNCVLFFNNSRVIRARIPLENKIAQRENGENFSINGEIFFLKNTSNQHFEALVRPGKKFKIGTKIFLGKYTLIVTKNTDSGRIFSLDGGHIFDCLEEFGNLPLPPYIEYSQEKEKDYQSIFAQKNGSVASPTASLHFSQELLQNISQEKNFVTLHIWLGTFKPIDTDDIRKYDIHSERCEIDSTIFAKIFEIKNSKKKITAVGTTACRTLESLASLWKNLSTEQRSHFDENIQNYWNSLSQNANEKWIENIIFWENFIEFSTKAYITPWYKFSIIDELITNFHLPESSLLVLVSALIGRENTLHRYHEAIQNNYKFFSFGDGMYICENE